MEQIIRCIPKILGSLLREQLISGEILRTLMAEIEGILNSRPLTPNSDNSTDLEPLNPNHLFLRRSNLNKLPPGVYVREGRFVLLNLDRWRQVQYLTNQCLFEEMASTILALSTRTTEMDQTTSEFCCW